MLGVIADDNRCLTKIGKLLYTVDQVHPIYCEASDLLRLSPFSLDPVAGQVQGVSQSLSSLSDYG